MAENEKKKHRNPMMREVASGERRISINQSNDKGKLDDIQFGLNYLSEYLSENPASPNTSKSKASPGVVSRKTVLGVIQGKSNSRLENKLFALLAEVHSSSDGEEGDTRRHKNGKTGVNKRLTTKSTLDEALQPKANGDAFFTNKNGTEGIFLTETGACEEPDPSTAPKSPPSAPAYRSRQNASLHTSKRNFRALVQQKELVQPATRVASNFDPDKLESISRHRAALEKRSLMKEAMAEKEKADREFRARPVPVTHYQPRDPTSIQRPLPPAVPYNLASHPATLGEYADQLEQSYLSGRKHSVSYSAFKSKSARDPQNPNIKGTMRPRPFSSNESHQSLRLQLAGQESLTPSNSKPGNLVFDGDLGRSDYTNTNGAAHNYSINLGSIQSTELNGEELESARAAYYATRISTARKQSSMLARQQELLERRRKWEAEGLKKKEEDELQELKKHPDIKNTQESWEKAKAQSEILKQRYQQEQLEREAFILLRQQAAKREQEERKQKLQEEERKKDRIRKRLAKRAALAARRNDPHLSTPQPSLPQDPSLEMSLEAHSERKTRAEEKQMLFDEALQTLMNTKLPSSQGARPKKKPEKVADQRSDTKKSFEDVQWERMYAEFKAKRDKEEGATDESAGENLSEGEEDEEGNFEGQENIIDEDENSTWSQREKHVHYVLPAEKPQTSRELAPYERFEKGQLPFFDKSSSEDKGRFRVFDAKLFVTDSIHRKLDPATAQGGVTLLIGERTDDPGVHQVITVLFDRTVFSEEDAKVWWSYNRDRFVKNN